jgi:tetratricopeptide (TPR) repeat protein
LAESLEGDLQQDSARRDALKYVFLSGAEEAAEAGARLGDLYQSRKDSDSARSYFVKVARLKSHSPWIAYARMKLAQEIEEQTRFSPLEKEGKGLETGLQRRVEFLARLSREYNDVVSAGGPWAFAAMNRLAGVVDRLAQELKAVPSAGALVVQLQNQAHAARVKAYSQLEKNEVLSPAVVELSSQLVRFAQGPRGGFRIAGVSPQATEETLSQIRSRLTQNSKNSGAWVDYGNVLWGQGKSRLAELAFDYALSLNPKEASALNNRAAMILLSGGGEEDWIEANRANELLKRALQVDSFLVAAQVNRASLLNYYHVFAPAKKLWNQVLARSASPESFQRIEAQLSGEITE